MKKRLFLLFAVIGMLLFGGCSKEKPYSVYMLSADISGAADKAMAQKLVDFLGGRGYIRTFIIEGADEKANDAQAISNFGAIIEKLKKENIEEFMAGTKGAPCTIVLTSKLIKGSTNQSMLASENLTIEVREKPTA